MKLPASPGLCGRCRHARAVTNRIGSVFLLCRRSRTSDLYPRYPRLPVRRCPGHEEGVPEGSTGTTRDVH